MWTTLLWLSLGITLGVTGSTVYLSVTQRTIRSACEQAAPASQAWAPLDTQPYTPHGHWHSLGSDETR